jgi:hypothetical protein
LLRALSEASNISISCQQHSTTLIPVDKYGIIRSTNGFIHLNTKQGPSHWDGDSSCVKLLGTAPSVRTFLTRVPSDVAQNVTANDIVVIWL